MRVAVIAGVVALLGMACERAAEEALPKPKNAGLVFACYPVQFVHPPMGPPTRWCEVANPERADAYVVVMDVGVDGSILKASISEEPSEQMSACLVDALREWRLEPARNCMGEPLGSRYEMGYLDVFGRSSCLPESILPGPTAALQTSDAQGGRTSGCS
jgi:hypothetical protein